jgi:putative toxin-antitoxin system antitoxin component (TIGR02293 family)
MKTPSRTAIRKQAELLFGSRAESRAWLSRPAMALEQRRPIDLLDTAEGRRVLSNLLTQLEYGVYV